MRNRAMRLAELALRAMASRMAGRIRTLLRAMGRRKLGPEAAGRRAGRPHTDRTTGRPYVPLALARETGRAESGESRARGRARDREWRVRDAERRPRPRGAGAVLPFGFTQL